MNQAKASTDGKLLATALAKVYSRCISEPYSTPEGRTLAEENLTQTGASEGYKDCWDTINDSYRSVCQAVLDEQALQPLRSTVTAAKPQYEKLKAGRSAALLDYDANRRRLTAAKEKRTDNERKGKHVGDVAITDDAKIERLEYKKAMSGNSYETTNEELKQFCIQTKARHDELMDELVINTAVCQLEYYKRAAAELQNVVDTLPQDRVNEITGRIDELMAAGGHIAAARPAPEKRKSMLEGFASAFNFSGNQGPPTGRPVSQEQGDTAREGARVGSPRSAAKAMFDSNSNDRVNENPFGEEDDYAQETEAPPAEPSAPAPPAPVSNPPKKSRFVKALYDHDAEADDELTFKEGDIVEVLETGDGGWWSGRCNGAIGDFPVDFVDTSNYAP